MSVLIERFRCRGHRNVLATHRSTLEMTTESYLTPKGDCIICVEAEKAVRDLNDDIKRALRSGAKVEVRISAGNLSDVIMARGSPRLLLTDDVSMVIRRSTYIDARTLAVRANKAAKDLDRRLVELLRDPRTEVVVEIRVY